MLNSFSFVFLFPFYVPLYHDCSAIVDSSQPGRCAGLFCPFSSPISPPFQVHTSVQCLEAAHPLLREGVSFLRGATFVLPLRSLSTTLSNYSCSSFALCPCRVSPNTRLLLFGPWVPPPLHRGSSYSWTKVSRALGHLDLAFFFFFFPCHTSPQLFLPTFFCRLRNFFFFPHQSCNFSPPSFPLFFPFLVPMGLSRWLTFFRFFKKTTQHFPGSSPLLFFV